MKWVVLDNGSWFNMDFAVAVFVAPKKDQADVFDVNIVNDNHGFLWKTDFKSQENAQNWLNEKMRKL